MRVLISGSSGLVGSAVTAKLAAAGHEVGRLIRPGGPCGPADASWDPQAGKIDAAALASRDAVIHLAGESIAGRWTEPRKARIRDSRVLGTRLLCDALARPSSRPAVLVCASAVGYYGDCGGQVVTEDIPNGEGFLAEVCRDWEAAAQGARQAGIRVVHLRFGVVLSPRGGALATMLPAFRLGLGGPVGGGRQYWSWVTLEDAVAAVAHSLACEALAGPVNIVSPNPVTSADFAHALGRILGRPAVMPLPAMAARLLLGEMADALLLASTRAIPRKLLDSGFLFRHAELGPALREILG